MKIYERLKQARKEKNITQGEVAKILMTTQPQIAKYESGQQEPTASRIIEFCKLYEISSTKLRQKSKPYQSRDSFPKGSKPKRSGRRAPNRCRAKKRLQRGDAGRSCISRYRASATHSIGLGAEAVLTKWRNPCGKRKQTAGTPRNTAGRKKDCMGCVQRNRRGKTAKEPQSHRATFPVAPKAIALGKRRWRRRLNRNIQIWKVYKMNISNKVYLDILTIDIPYKV